MEALAEEHKKFDKAHLGHAVNDCQRTIELLMKAREGISSEPQNASMVLAKLNQPIKQSFDKITDDLKRVYNAQRDYGKALDRVGFKNYTLTDEIITKICQKFKDKAIPDIESDALGSQTGLVNRAIAMHILREGQFSVANTFLEETEPQTRDTATEFKKDALMKDAWEKDMASAKVQSEELQQQFAEMYHILHELKQQKNLAPAIRWARDHSRQLDQRGSNLEFELCRLQFVALFIGYDINGNPGPADDGPVQAWEYARREFPAFQQRYNKEINQLVGSMAFFQNLGASPYQHIFNNDTAWEDVAQSFTREFCSLLGLSADSPLYIAATAGAIALPTLVKLRAIMKDKRTEWTTEDELPVDTPLPPGYQFHSIFVCPVSKEQSTENNPPMMMPCGHVICKESLERISKNSRFKCPYCPSESHFQDAVQVYL
ncbi:MAG: hypothetical protein M1820_006995 [Bogoriella megaspora]|nr:MAG: hypothetical protein M1820_006995 [Bogoriella megaspora]